MRKKCAVCGDTHKTNVRLKWVREFDLLVFDVCMMCAETGKVNENSVNTFGGGIPATPNQLKLAFPNKF